ncbi:hypothetical protein ACS0TY_027125 [Phlomoides rotata]
MPPPSSSPSPSSPLWFQPIPPEAPPPSPSSGGRQSFVLLVALLLMPTAWIDNMSTLSYLSATGVVAAIFILGSVLWSGIFDGIGFHEKGELFHWKGLPTSLGLYALCFCGHPIFHTLYTSMKNPRHFPLILFIYFLVCTATYGAMAMIGVMQIIELTNKLIKFLPKTNDRRLYQIRENRKLNALKNKQTMQDTGFTWFDQIDLRPWEFL